MSADTLFDARDHLLTVPPYHAHRSYMKSLWIVPAVLFGLYMLTLIGRFAATTVHIGWEATKDTVKRKAKSAVSIVSGSSVAPPSVTAAEIEPIEGEHSRATTVSPTDEQEEEEDWTSLWLRRLHRASRAARRSFLLSTVIATLASLPIEYACRVQPIDGTPGAPIPLPPCGTCLGNAASLPLTIMQWVFLALSVAWIFLDLFTSHASTVAGTHFVMTLLAQSLVLASFILAFKHWSNFRRRSC
ncbi:uncharacterized protein SPPG_09229 [Spizellomyces punctatus DAOM BR117]|uniref:Uncharacterized protein n=1 Tax=Spizellomyces punctatus (strain DAOM BR117) TaxID=645134 RepID=A0A0L0HFB9_SPIPD|nr:uncharacterized protein SPPG_09229 [Spizellomyces punctatus DAOM BR117]KNC99493.1 hypothetical protein SPPG_09229 [Spizellomyces punctatus DAOM BR117]|eukprot:XP_016607533.1 hypothetical protein SPPG_09229 [Spizellomyces punctatus DAOM BR117]